MKRQWTLKELREWPDPTTSPFGGIPEYAIITAEWEEENVKGDTACAHPEAETEVHDRPLAD